jgi:AraC family transcriptional regulator of adaptative response/methylated-DNA-[protein]-cysteine methyltransferase
MSSDYARIARAIEYLDEHHVDQPQLSELAHLVDLSDYHFQRLFLRWAGVTPKSFLQFVTLGHAKRLLREPRSLLQSSVELGLSGPSRLHDLFLTYEGMTPGEYKVQAEGMILRWGVHETPFGEALIAATDKGLCGMMFTDGDHPTALREVRAQWAGATWREDARFTRSYAEAIDARVRGQQHQPLSVLLKGTPFQLKVWEALLKIPEGSALSYQGLATLVGASGSARAVGGAVAANPIGYLIPCHRVIRATGALGGYHWGETRKRTILALECSRTNAR